jgi:hypothetical protein
MKSDANDHGFQILTDQEIVGSTEEEHNSEEEETEEDKEENNEERPSHSEAFNFP